MDGTFRRGATAALLAGSLALPVSAQEAPAGPSRARRDSLRAVQALVRVRLDSITTLLRAFGSEPLTSDASSRLRRELEEMTTMIRRVPLRANAQVFLAPPVSRAISARGWIGITTGDVPLQEQDTPDGHLVRYFAHPVVVSVDRSSPAQRAGITPGDSLIALDGADVVGRTLNLTRMLTPDRRLSVTVRRDGENKEYSIIVGKAPVRVFARSADSDDHGPPVIVLPDAWGDRPSFAQRFTLNLSNAGLFGASLMTLEPVLAKSLNLTPGVLVKGVPEATVADRAGLQIGDVIVAVGDQPVRSIVELQAASMSRADDRAATLHVIRDRKARVIVVTWTRPSSP